MQNLPSFFVWFVFFFFLSRWLSDYEESIISLWRIFANSVLQLVPGPYCISCLIYFSRS